MPHRRPSTGGNGFITKVMTLFLSLCLSSSVVLFMLGLVNQRLLNRRFATATLFYFADSRYLESVTFTWYARLRQWSPVLAGVFVHGRTGGFICVVGCDEALIQDPKNREKVIGLWRKMERFASLLRVPSASYAGILPSVFASMGVERDPIEVERTVHWIAQAIELVRKRYDPTCRMPLVVAGAAGHVGQRISALLVREGGEVIALDPRLPKSRSQSDLCQNQPVIFLNVTRGQAIADYVETLAPGSVVLNEVYPEADANVLEALSKRGVTYLHIQGIRAKAFPSFPRAYRGAVPCCAASAAVTLSRADGLSEEVLLREQ